MKVQKPMTDKLEVLSLMILLIAFEGNSNAQVETKTDMKPEIAKMEELITEELEIYEIKKKIQ